MFFLQLKGNTVRGVMYYPGASVEFLNGFNS